VLEVLESDWLTTGPRVGQFERAVAERCGAGFAVAVANGTAALQLAVLAAGVGPGDEVMVPAITFVATANAVVMAGAKPVFVDVDPETLLIDPEQLSRRKTQRCRAVIAVDYAGQPCDYERLRGFAHEEGLTLIADAAHALGARFQQRPVGALADLTILSFHPVKQITTGEGGMVLTDQESLAARVRRLAHHGVDRDFMARKAKGTFEYDMVELGFNYRITDLQCALGLSQLARLDQFLERRRAIANCYDRAFAKSTRVRPLECRPDVDHAYHLYVVRLEGQNLRQHVFQGLSERGIQANVHYRPVYLHSFYRERFGTAPGLCPNAESSYERILSLPMFYGLTDEEQSRVIDGVLEIVEREG
jgi:perosamine synthetase